MSGDALNRRKPVRCLVIQLARLGDTLQSLMALRAAKQLYPELEIHFVAREQFASAAKRVPWLASITVLPTAKLVRPVLDGQRTPRESLGDLARWLTPLAQEPWDILLNWSYSEPSSWLTALLPARIKLGFSRRPDGALSVVDGWSHFIQAVIHGGIHQNIHLTDVLTTQLLTALQIHVGDPADAGNEALTSKSFFSLELQPERFGPGWKDHSRKWVGIQLGAGSAAKAWDPENWAGVASHILTRHPDYSIVLLGGPAEKPLAERFMAKLRASGMPDPRVISMVGQTEFDLWATVVGRCQWLLAGDTAAIHLASILGTRVLNVSIGPVRHTETGPYGNGHYVISAAEACDGCARMEQHDPAAHSCRGKVSYEAVYAAWSYASSEWMHRRQIAVDTHFSRLGWSAHLAPVRVERSRIRSTNDGGGVVYESLLDRPMSLEEWTGQAIGTVARAWYCGWLPPIGHELKRSMIGPQLVSTLRGIDESCGVLHKICDEAARTAKRLQAKTQNLKSNKIMPLHDRQELAELAAKLSELDALMDRVGSTQPCLSAFSRMSKVLMHNLKSDRLADLGQESALSYEQITQGVTLVRDWVKHTLKMARPMAVAQGDRETAIREVSS